MNFWRKQVDKRFTVLAFAIIACGAGYFFLATPSVSEQHDEHEHGSHQLLNQEPANVAEQKVVRNGQLLSTGVSQLNKKSESNNTQVAANTFEKDSIIWQQSEQSQKVLQASGFMPEDVANEAYVEVDLEELQALEVGDNLDLYIPQLGGSYNGEVDHIQQHPNGDRTVEAFIPGAGTLYSAVITIGEEAIYGNLATQEDVFVLEGIGKHAWIAPKSAMIAKHRERIPTDPVTTSSNSTSPDVFELETEVSPTTSNNN